MNLESNFFSPYVLSILAGWLIAHIIKYLVSRSNGNKTSLRSHVFISGGMPSAHSATSLAVTTTIGWIDGLNSGLFGLAVLVSMVIVYDSMNLRRASGQQGEVIAELMKKSGLTKIKQPIIARGHTPQEVVAGVALGILIGTVVFFATL